MNPIHFCVPAGSTRPSSTSRRPHRRRGDLHDRRHVHVVVRITPSTLHRPVAGRVRTKYTDFPSGANDGIESQPPFGVLRELRRRAVRLDPDVAVLRVDDACPGSRSPATRWARPRCWTGVGVWITRGSSVAPGAVAAVAGRPPMGSWPLPTARVTPPPGTGRRWTRPRRSGSRPAAGRTGRGRHAACGVRGERVMRGLRGRARALRARRVRRRTRRLDPAPRGPADASRRTATSRTSSWSVSSPPKVRLARRATTSTRSPSASVRARSARPKAIPSSTSRPRLRTSCV